MVYKLSLKYRKKSYVELCHFALGKPGYIAACFFIFLFNYGTLVRPSCALAWLIQYLQVANLLVIATNVPEILQQWIKPNIWISRECMHRNIRFYAATHSIYADILMYICVLFLPVSFFKNITSYTINSVLSLTAVWILSGIVFVKLIYMYTPAFLCCSLVRLRCHS